MNLWKTSHNHFLSSIQCAVAEYPSWWGIDDGRVTNGVETYQDSAQTLLAVIHLWKFGLSSGGIEVRGEEGKPCDTRADDGLLVLCLADEHFIGRWLGGFETEGRSTGSAQIGIDKKNTLAEVGKSTS